MKALGTVTMRVPLSIRLESVNSPHVRRILLFAAVVFLIAGCAFSVHRHPEALAGLQWEPMVLLLIVAVPATILCNAVEFAVMGRMVQQAVPLPRALEITILTSAANLLPFPGGALVRIAALKAGGARYRSGTAVTLLAALIWIGVSLAYAGVWMVVIAPGALSMLFTSAGIALVVTSGIVLRRLDFGLRTGCSILLVRLVLVLLDAARLYLCLMALNAGAGFAEASAFAAASAAGSAVSVIPGGLGVREAATAALAPIVGVSSAIGFLAATLNRLVGLPVLVPIALLLSRRRIHTGV